MSRTSRIAAAALAGLLFAAGSASAQSYRGGPADTFRLDVGGFFETFDTTVRYDRSNGVPGTEFRLEDALGQEDRKTTPRLDGHLRLGRKAKLDFGYRGWRRTSSRTLTQEIDFGDHVYQVGATVDADMRVDVADLYFAYSFVNNGVVEAGLGLGASTYWSRFTVDAAATATGGGTAAAHEERSDVAPIPALEAHLSGMLLQGVYGFAKLKALDATIRGRSGKMLDLKAGLEYRGTHLGIGAAYHDVDITYEQKYEDVQGLRFEYKYHGPVAYLILSF